MDTPKKIIVDVLRKTYLLQMVDNLMFVGRVLKAREKNAAFLADHPGFLPPPASLAYDAYNHVDWQAYHGQGQKHASLISDMIGEYLTGNEIKVLEWGCGPARVIRHLDKIDGFEEVELFGTDYNRDSIRWCGENIQNIHFAENNLEPPLPFEDGMFDCIYAISIFTHLSEKMHYAWIGELFRLLKPNGILIFTTHGDLCAAKLLETDKALYDSGALVVKGQIKEGKKHFAAYQPPQFVKDELLKDSVVVKHLSNPSHYQLDQEVWVVKKV